MSSTYTHANSSWGYKDLADVQHDIGTHNLLECFHSWSIHCINLFQVSIHRFLKIYVANI